MYQPALGSVLTVSLPGETVRAAVARVVDGDTVLVELGSPVLNVSRQHTWRMGDIVCARRTFGDLGEYWEAMDERRMPVAAMVPDKPPPKRGKVKAAHQRKAQQKRKARAQKAKR